jgi:hypothetical protein
MTGQGAEPQAVEINALFRYQQFQAEQNQQMVAFSQ